MEGCSLYQLESWAELTSAPAHGARDVEAKLAWGVNGELKCLIEGNWLPMDMLAGFICWMKLSPAPLVATLFLVAALSCQASSAESSGPGRSLLQPAPYFPYCRCDDYSSDKNAGFCFTIGYKGHTEGAPECYEKLEKSVYKLIIAVNSQCTVGYQYMSVNDVAWSDGSVYWETQIRGNAIRIVNLKLTNETAPGTVVCIHNDPNQTAATCGNATSYFQYRFQGMARQVDYVFTESFENKCCGGCLPLGVDLSAFTCTLGPIVGPFQGYQVSYMTVCAIGTDNQTAAWNAAMTDICAAEVRTYLGYPDCDVIVESDDLCGDEKSFRLPCQGGNVTQLDSSVSSQVINVLLRANAIFYVIGFELAV
eukprot:gene24797-10442_t